MPFGMNARKPVALHTYQIGRYRGSLHPLAESGDWRVRGAETKLNNS